MKEIIENLLKEERRTKAELAEFLGVSTQGLQYKLKEDAWKHTELQLLSKFFKVDTSTFVKKNSFVKQESKDVDFTLWENLIKEKDLRIEELMNSLRDARYTITLQKNLLKDVVPFLNVSEESPAAIMKIIYGGQFGLKTA